MSTIKEFLIRAEAAEIIVKYLEDNGFLSGYDL